MRKNLVSLIVVAAVVAAASAHAAPPARRIPFSTTVPLPTGTYYFRFSLWDANGVAAPGTMVWSEEKRLAVRSTLAGAAARAPLRQLLGSVNPFAAPVRPPYPAVDFSRQLWVQVAYRTTPTRPWRAIKKRTALAMAPYTIWSERAEAARDADTVDGLHASELGQQQHTHDGSDVATGAVAEARIDPAIARDAELQSHAERTDNPHQVTAAQAGAATAQHVHGADEITSGVFSFASLPTGTGADQVAVGSHAHDAAYYAKAHVDALEGRIAALESANAALGARLAALETASAAAAEVLEHLSHAETGGVHTVVLSGANLQVVDGSGDTEGASNGMGNLIVGYNGSRVQLGGTDLRTGSHNLIVGDQNNYTSYGGFVAGQRNTIGNTYAAVSGGWLNTASGTNAAVSGGVGNTASGPFATVGGGGGNTASGPNAAIAGGSNNQAIGSAAVVSGGYSNFATGTNAAVGGGYGNSATSSYATVGGGAGNMASGSYATVGGGSAHIAGGEYDWRAGTLFEDQ